MKWGRSMVGQERTAGMEIDGQEQAGVGQRDKDGWE